MSLWVYRYRRVSNNLTRVIQYIPKIPIEGGRHSLSSNYEQCSTTGQRPEHIQAFSTIVGDDRGLLATYNYGR